MLLLCISISNQPAAKSLEKSSCQLSNLTCVDIILQLFAQEEKLESFLWFPQLASACSSELELGARTQNRKKLYKIALRCLPITILVQVE